MAVVAISAIGVLAYLALPRLIMEMRNPNADVPDDVLIERAKTFPESRAFLQKYPNATAAVFWKGEGVGFTITEFQLTRAHADERPRGEHRIVLDAYLDANLNSWWTTLYCHQRPATPSPSLFDVRDEEIISFLADDKELVCFE